MQVSPVRRTKSQAKQAYDRLSPHYDWLAGSSETPMMQRGLEMLDFQPGECVLEIGCGTGKALAEISSCLGGNGIACGVDISPGMLRRARHRLRQQAKQNSTALLEGDRTSLPFNAMSFGAVFLSFTFELFDTLEIPRVLSECRRVLSSSGRLGVVSLVKTSTPSPIVRLYEWFHVHIPQYVDCRPIDALEAITKAGFTITKLEQRSLWGLPVALVLASNP